MAGVLAVIDRGWRGNPAEFTDLLSFCVGLRAGFRPVDLILRGQAAGCALDAGPAGVGGMSGAGNRADQQRFLGTLIRTGGKVWVDAADLATLGHPAMRPGVLVTDTEALAATWHEYERVWFL